MILISEQIINTPKKKKKKGKEFTISLKHLSHESKENDY